MKLVMTYSTGDGCTWSEEHIKLFEYDSEEALLCDFMDAVRAAKAAHEAYDTKRISASRALREAWIRKAAEAVQTQLRLRVLEVHNERPADTFNFCGGEWSWSDFYDSKGEAELPPHLQSFETYFAQEGFWKGKQ